MPSQDLLLRQPPSKAVTFICLQIGIWQRCQISPLFHEDAQGAQVINLSILHHGLLWDHRLLQNEKLRGALGAGIG
jgi:hypothetical protein